MNEMWKKYKLFTKLRQIVSIFKITYIQFLFGLFDKKSLKMEEKLENKITNYFFKRPDKRKYVIHIRSEQVNIVKSFEKKITFKFFLFTIFLYFNVKN